jgi:hypothetical protein
VQHETEQGLEEKLAQHRLFWAICESSENSNRLLTGWTDGPIYPPYPQFSFMDRAMIHQTATLFERLWSSLSSVCRGRG